jgi:membrane protease subunit HflK
MLTADENIVDVQFSVQYKVKDPVAWVFNNSDQVETVRGSAETAMRELVGRSKMDALLFEGRDKLAGDAQRMIQQMLERYKLGAEVAGVTDAVAVRAGAGGGRLRGNRQGPGRPGQGAQRSPGLCRRHHPASQGQGGAHARRCQAYRATTENTAAGNAARFNQVVAEYAKAPGVTRDRMYLDTMQQIFSSTSKVMIDTKTATTVNLPLDQMLSRSVANEAAIGSRSGPVMPRRPSRARRRRTWAR